VHKITFKNTQNQLHCNVTVWQVLDSEQYAFKWRQNTQCQSMFRICTGSEFEAAGPATVNELSAAKRVPVRCITQLPRVIIGGGDS